MGLDAAAGVRVCSSLNILFGQYGPGLIPSESRRSLIPSESIRHKQFNCRVSGLLWAETAAGRPLRGPAGMAAVVRLGGLSPGGGRGFDCEIMLSTSLSSLSSVMDLALLGHDGCSGRGVTVLSLTGTQSR